MINSIVLRPISSGERSDWDSLMAKHAYLGFLNPIFFKYCHCNGNKIHYLKTIDYDKNGEKEADFSSLL